MKSLFDNSLYYITYRLINVIYPLITATYVSRVLKPSGIGEVALAQNVVIFLVAVALLGIPNYGVREISKTSGKELNLVFTELFIINLIATCVIACGYYYVVSLSTFHLNRTLYNIYGIILLFNIINVDWFYQGKEEFKYITIRSCIVKLISIFAIFLFVKDESDLCTYGLIFAFTYIGNYTFNVLNLRKFVKFEFRNINIIRHLKSIFTLAITAISNEIYVTLDTLMLGVMSTSAEIGYYSNSMKLMRILINVVTALGTVILPRLSQLENDNNFNEFNKIINIVIDILLWITIPCTIGILILPEFIETVLFGEEFLPAAPILSILSLLVIPRAFSNMSLQILICTKNDTKTSKVYFTGMLINVALNFIFIQYAGANGAAIASVISEIYICVVLLHYAKKTFIYTKSNRFYSCLFIAASTMSILVFLCKCFGENFQSSAFILLTICMLIGGVSYCGISILLKNEVPMLLIDKLKDKIIKRG